jgi:hypothetical protein
MKDIEQRKSPLQIKMDELGKKLSIFSFAIIACIMALGIFQGKTFLSMFNIGKLSGNCWFGWVVGVVFVLLMIMPSSCRLWVDFTSRPHQSVLPVARVGYDICVLCCALLPAGAVVLPYPAWLLILSLTFG